MCKKLYLFTAHFPYGMKETYLEDEILFLSDKFDSIEIFPFSYNPNIRRLELLPNNVFVHRPVIPHNKFIRIFLGLFYFFNIKSSLIFLKELTYVLKLKSSIHLFKYLMDFLNYLISVNSKQFASTIHDVNSVFYFYWGNGWAYSQIFRRKYYKKNKSFLRLHGGEVYLERANGYLPLRIDMFSSFDTLLPISISVSKYIESVYGLVSLNKIHSPLGASFFSLNPINYNNEVIHIVSCSNIIELKRIHLIISSLSFVKDIKIHWVHFGDGKSDIVASLLKECSNLGTNIKYEFKGQCALEDIKKYYSINYIDAFINVSKYEGVPVSIMEAMSFGIPVIATDVGATREIVNNYNGVLLEPEFKIQELFTLYYKFRCCSWVKKRKIAFNTWSSQYNSKVNYSNTAHVLFNS